MNVLNPATLEVIGECPDAGPDEAPALADAAYEAFRDWSRRTPDDRAELVARLAARLEREAPAFSELLVRESGKPHREAEREVASAVAFLRWNAEEGRRVYGRVVPSPSSDLRSWTIQQPIGVVVAITPWNYPLNTLCRKVGPALAAGCTVIAKPAPETPLSTIRLARLAVEAGIPEAVFQVVTTSRAGEVVDSWMHDARVRKIAFTGSTAVGRRLFQAAAETMKRVSLELGGNAPVLVFSDADLDHAADAIAASRYRHAGQTCICAQRIFVDARAHRPLVERIEARIARLRVGNGLDDETDVGPLIHERALARVADHVADALQAGARLRAGGEQIHLPAPNQGFFFAPTLLDDVGEGIRMMQEETFGPVLAVAPCGSEAEAIARANATEYGLAAYVFTRDLSRAIRAIEALEFGTIGVNSAAIIAPQLAFGGWKSSGIGRENGPEGLAEYLETKSAVVSIA